MFSFTNSYDLSVLITYSVILQKHLTFYTCNLCADMGAASAFCRLPGTNDDASLQSAALCSCGKEGRGGLFVKTGWFAVRTWQVSGPTAFEEDRKTLPPRLWMVHLGEANQFRNKVF